MPNIENYKGVMYTLFALKDLYDLQIDMLPDEVCIRLDKDNGVGVIRMKIMIFIEGTTFYTKPLLFLFTKYGYKPIGNAVEKVNAWYDKGNEIYLSSYVRKTRVGFIKSIIDFYGMKYTDILCRAKGEQYHEIVECLKPDILIEDDCRSIGGQKNCCITGVKDNIKKNIRSVIVPEFSGIDNIKID